MLLFFFFKQKTAYEMRISDWSSDVCSSDLAAALRRPAGQYRGVGEEAVLAVEAHLVAVDHHRVAGRLAVRPLPPLPVPAVVLEPPVAAIAVFAGIASGAGQVPVGVDFQRSEEHTSELQSLMRISYAVFCLKKKKEQT